MQRFKEFAKNHPFFVGVGSILGLVMLLGFCCIPLSMPRKEAQANLAEANRLWDAGNRAEAGMRYKVVLNKGLTYVDKSQHPIIFQRAIEIDVAQGNDGDARTLVEQAIKRGLALTSGDPKSRELIALVTTERQREQDEAKAERDYQRPHLQALNQIADHFDHVPNPTRNANDTPAVVQKWNLDLTEMVGRFMKIKLDLSKTYQREEAIKMIEVYERRIQGRYKGWSANAIDNTMSGLVSTLSLP